MRAPTYDLERELGALLGDVAREIEISKRRRIFCNRNLRMESVELIGFDTDYTLALYHQDKLEQLSIELPLAVTIWWRFRAICSGRLLLRRRRRLDMRTRRGLGESGPRPGDPK